MTDTTLLAPLRASLLDRIDAAEPRRLFHGRGRLYEGLEAVTVDLYPPVAVITFYGPTEEALRDAVAGVVLETIGARVDAVVQQERLRSGTRSQVLLGDVAEDLVVEEQGLKYRVRPLENQNTGLFLDVAPLRSWLRERVAGHRVLNLFAYTCAFSVAAGAGGARSVVNLDLSRTSLDIGRENHLLNDLDTRAYSFLAHDVFRSWQKLKRLGPYETLIIDPPTRQRGSFDAEKDYPALLKRIPMLAAPGAQILALLNSPFLPRRFLTEQMSRRCPACRFVDWLPVSADFPDESTERGLKIGLFRYEG